MSLKIVIPKNIKNFDKFIDKLIKSHKTLGAEVGVIKNSRGYDRREGKPKDITVAEEAFINSNGDPAKKIPPRPYQDRTIEENKDKWKKGISILLKHKLGTEKVCEAIGLVARDDTRRNISQFTTPRNAKKTIEIKGKDSPLVDYGDLLKSIEMQVVDINEKKVK